MSDIADFVQSVKSSRHKLGPSAEKLADLMSSRPTHRTRIVHEHLYCKHQDATMANIPRGCPWPDEQTPASRPYDTVIRMHRPPIAPRACPSTLLRTVSLLNRPACHLTGFVTSHLEQCGLESRGWNAIVSNRPL